MCQNNIENLKKKLWEEFPRPITVIDIETMRRIKNFKLPSNEEEELIKDIATLECCFPGTGKELLSELENLSKK